MALASRELVLYSRGITEAPREDVEKEVAMFMIAAYGGSRTIMSKCCKWLWAQNIARSYSAPKLASLPLTTEGFLQNAKRTLNQILRLSTDRTMAGRPMTSTRLFIQLLYCRRSVLSTTLHSEAPSLWL